MIEYEYHRKRDRVAVLKSRRDRLLEKLEQTEEELTDCKPKLQQLENLYLHPLYLNLYTLLLDPLIKIIQDYANYHFCADHGMYTFHWKCDCQYSCLRKYRNNTVCEYSTFDYTFNKPISLRTTGNQPTIYFTDTYDAEVMQKFLNDDHVFISACDPLRGCVIDWSNYHDRWSIELTN